jgi:hypothetical protein
MLAYQTVSRMCYHLIGLPETRKWYSPLTKARTKYFEDESDLYLQVTYATPHFLNLIFRKKFGFIFNMWCLLSQHSQKVKISVNFFYKWISTLTQNSHNFFFYLFDTSHVKFWHTEHRPANRTNWLSES